MNIEIKKDLERTSDGDIIHLQFDNFRYYIRLGYGGDYDNLETLSVKFFVRNDSCSSDEFNTLAEALAYGENCILQDVKEHLTQHYKISKDNL